MLLHKSNVTDEVLINLKSLQGPVVLHLDQTKVTGVGLKSLESLRGLKQLRIRGLNVTPEALATFEASLPECNAIKYGSRWGSQWNRLSQGQFLH